MAFILQTVSLSPKDSSKISALYERYRQYLQSIRDKMPVAAFSFATADWHYNAEDHRCPHDSWLDTLTIREPAAGERSEIREIEMHLRLLGSYHDGYIEITYKKVKSYSLDSPFESKMPPRVRVGHGDWLIDEFRLSDRGYVVHEILFSRGSQWVIECEDILYEWKPFV
jgi:hypothetical protein